MRDELLKVRPLLKIPIMNRVMSYVVFVVLTTLVIGLDQLSKYWVTLHLQLGQSVTICSWLNLNLQYNRGAAFSLFDSAGGWQVYVLAAVAIIVCLGLIVWLVQRPQHNSLQIVAVSLLIGGAGGNLIDRLRFQHVFDFIDFHIGDWHYATFNLADSAITGGVILLMLSLVLTRR